MRIDGWDDALLGVIERHRAAAYAPGKHDCFMLAMDAAEALTGARPYAVRYASDAAALKVLRKRGFASLREAIAAVYPERPAGHWQRGDIAVLAAPTASGDTLGLVYGPVLLVRQGNELKQLPLSSALAVFAVG
ncbi:DUF6950 family protein [Bosea lathyri]|uniref:DUF6950 domain-containing protein n=1 Tax=Bosea lathyri TaxID=1036778 RepID=A0A1H6BEJ6_9HYPH|nr:hypothetical protein [Bosea lathyri]SEG59211.1 hypothetical protein SAMN04488115_107183 [Bosea lathyri]